MTLEAEEGLLGIEEVAVHRAMGAMTEVTVFCHISMFIAERTSLIRMALYARLLDIILYQVVVCKAAMNIVAVSTEDSPLPQGMVTRQCELHLGCLVTAETELARCQWGDL
jgi:hypothetical protein